MNRRDFLRHSAVLGAAGMLAPALVQAAAAPPLMTVYKTPTCGCCKEWVTHMKSAGFTLKVVDMDDISEIKTNAGVPGKLSSCHTALIGAYVIEGHVPADLVTKLLATKPKILGLAVPGMVQGSPGMETGVKQAYDVVAFDRGGKTSVYAKR